MVASEASLYTLPASFYDFSGRFIELEATEGIITHIYAIRY